MIPRPGDLCRFKGVWIWLRCGANESTYFSNLVATVVAFSEERCFPGDTKPDPRWGEVWVLHPELGVLSSPFDHRRDKQHVVRARKQ